jgi:hypothetical protein
VNLSVCLHWRILFELARGAVPCCARVSCSVEIATMFARSAVSCCARVSCSVEVATVAARCSYSCSNLLVVKFCVCVLVGVATDTHNTPNLAHGFLMGCDTFLRCASIH